MVKATELLMQEHRVIERVLSALERAVDRLERGIDVDATFFLRAAEFIRGFADGCHHQKEEGVLFEALREAGMPSDAGPIAVMLHEHELARGLTRELGEAAGRLQAGDERATEALVRAGREYAALLRQHILKEDNVLFPMADQMIPVPRQESVHAEFERMASEACNLQHGTYVMLAEELERQVGL